VLSPATEAMSSKPAANTSTERVSAGIRHSLVQTREQLADTMETLTQKVQVPSGIEEKWHATKDTAQATIEKATRHLHGGKKTVQDKTKEVAQQAKGLTNQAATQIPAPVAGRASDLAQAVRQRPAPAVTMVFAIFALLLLRRFLSRATG
jgi:ElaB/YqjD/DUF883 family membrane-anchored ribosome-binding protein